MLGVRNDEIIKYSIFALDVTTLRASYLRPLSATSHSDVVLLVGR